MQIDSSRSPSDARRADAFLDQWNPDAIPSGQDSLAWGPPGPIAPGVTGVTESWSPAPGEAAEADCVLDDSRIAGAAGPATGGAPPLGHTTRAVVAPDLPIVFPRLGEAIGGFRLISELGRGAFARVYLAHEAALGNRPVALKVSKAEGDEPKVLARLQHTHIVPIHSVHDDPVTGLRLICMPYIGGANLAQVLDAAVVHPAGTAKARSLIDALDLIALPAPSGPPSRAAGRDETRGRAGVPPTAVGGSRGPFVASLRRSFFRPGSRRTASDPGGTDYGPGAIDERGQPARAFLRGSDLVHASAWIAARLAEGLEHAHSRGLLHRDLKPSNVLIAADGTPMLLDFNLAAEALDADPEDGARAMLGGTLPYMAPEHLDAFNPLGSTPPEAVDERSDLYALGLILFEMVAGRPAFPDPPDGLDLVALLAWLTAERRKAAPSLRAANPKVAWGLDAIVAKCLDPEPDRRHRSAGELAEDLRRFLDDRPLKFTPEPSARERLAKWSRRHPRASSIWTIAPLASALILAATGVAWTQTGHLREVSARLNLRRFREDFDRCQFLLNTSGSGGLDDHLRLGVDRSHALIERFGVGRRADWSRGYWVAPLAPDEREGLRRDLAELILLESRARVRLAKTDGTEDERRRALEWAVAWLDRAESIDPSPSPALFAERARYHHALGRADLARSDRERAESTPSATCRDEYLLGTADLADGRPDQAERRLRRAVALDAKRFWPWFALGLCHFDQGRYADAVGDFNVCTVLMPEFAWPFANRGLALARAGRLPEAIDSFDRAVALSPTFAEALASRGLVLLEAGEAARAERDLARAIELGRRDVSVRAGRAEALAKLGRPAEAMAVYDALIAGRPFDARLLSARGMARLATDPKGAEADFLAALANDRGSAPAHYGLARVRFRSDPMAALDHVDRALVADPAHLDALQLRALVRAHLGRLDALDDVDRLLQTPTPHRLYNAACALSVLSRSDPTQQARALDLLRRALESGFPAEPARDDPDLDALRPRADFRALVGLNRASP